MNADRLKLEEDVLWSCVENPGQYARWAPVLGPEMFSSPKNKKTAQALRYLLENGRDINLTTLGAMGANLLMPEGTEHGNVDLFIGAKKLTEWAIWDLRDDVTRKFKAASDPFEIITAVNEATNLGSALIAAHDEVPKSKLVEDYISSVEENRDGRVLHIPTGIPTLDDFTKGGLKIGNTSFLGGAPGTGKTSLMLQIAMNAAERGFGAAIIEGEMLTEELLLRMNGQHCRVPYHEIERGDRMDELIQFSKHLIRVPMAVTGVYNRTVDNLVGAVRRAIHNGAKLVCIDYMQVFVEKGKAENEFSQIKALSEKLRQITLINRVHLLVASSLNRLEAGAKNLTLNSFYGGSQLGHDCWAGMILVPEEDPVLGSDIRFLTLDVVKVRGGRVGRVPIRYELETQYMCEQTDIQVHDPVLPFNERGQGEVYNDDAT